MGVFKNEVGRPSNEVIKTRKVLKILGMVVTFCIFFAIGYFAAGNLGTSEEGKIDAENNEEVKNNKKFDKSKITTSKVENTEDGIYVYVYGQKLNIEAPLMKLGNVEVLDDIAILELVAMDVNILVIVNMEGEILYNTVDNVSSGYYCSSLKTNECYGFKINDNKVTYYIEDLGQDPLYVCETNYNNEVLNEYELTYENGKLSMPKKLSSLMGKEYITKHNISCE